LHPPGRPERSRLPELTATGVPTLVVQGERDPMGTPEEFPEDTDVAVVPEADHGLKVPARAALTQDEALGLVVESVLEWLVREVTGNR
jgi:predicted alpha/beta-hydrolase family hydrolase